MNKKFKSLKIIVPVVVLLIIFISLCLVRVPGGYVGSIYSLKDGITDRVVDAGLKIVKPWEQVSLYSIATEQMELTKKDTKLSPDDESFNATCRDGVLNVDLEMSYKFEAEDVAKIAQKYKNRSGEDIMNNIIKSKIKTYVNEVTSEYTIMEAYMDKKEELNDELFLHLQEKLAPYGVVVEGATLPRAEPGDSIKKAIAERSQRAQEVEAAKQEQEKAKIEAETARIKAKGEADAAIEKARGEAKANEIVSKSLTDNLLELELIKARQEHGWVEVQGANTVVTK